MFPHLQAAFIGIGSEKNAFLHFSDLSTPNKIKPPGNKNGLPQRQSNCKQDSVESLQNTLGRKLKKGNELLVQVEREAVGSKGPRVTAQLAIPGRCLVLIPGIPHIGVSRKIDDPATREKIKHLVQQCNIDSDNGYIIRTAAMGANEDELKRDVDFLDRIWSQILRKFHSDTTPSLLYEEAHLYNNIIRDLFVSPRDSMIIGSTSLYIKIRDYLAEVVPEMQTRISLYSGNQSVFGSFGIENAIEQLNKKYIWLKSGGVITIDHTEALVAIDVNTARSTGRKGGGDLILNTNLEAAKEIARQVRLRNIGGIIVIDFIDMETEAHKKAVLKELREAFSKDRSRRRILDFSEFGLVQITRKQIGPSFFQLSTEQCPTCKGKGSILSKSEFAAMIMRELQRVCSHFSEKEILIGVHPAMADYLRRKISDDPGCFVQELDATIEIKAINDYNFGDFSFHSKKTGQQIQV